MIRPPVLVLAALLMSTALPASAEIYSWRDKDGKIHYADQAPPSGEVKVLRGGVPQTSAPAPATPAQGEAAAATKGGVENKPKSVAEQEQAFRQRRAEAAEAQAKAEKENTDSADRERQCSELRNQLAALQSGQRMARYGSSGERVVMDDAMRAEETGRTQRQIEEGCR